MRLHFREYGRGAPLILLHGLFGSLDNWQQIGKALADRFRVLALDQRNHGASPHGEEMNYPILANDLDGFMHEHSIASACVLGHSMGGKAAMTFALRRPDRVDKLIVADIAARAYGPKHDAIFDALCRVDLAAYHSRRQIEAALAPSIPDLAMRQFLLKGLAREPNGAFRWKFNLADLRRNYSSLNAAVEAGPPFNKPALFIRGGRSPYVQETDAEMIREQFPRAEISVIPEAGHWLHAEAPEKFVAIARNFLEKEF